MPGQCRGHIFADLGQPGRVEEGLSKGATGTSRGRKRSGCGRARCVLIGDSSDHAGQGHTFGGTATSAPANPGHREQP
jgi:hypothetical protein